MITDWGGWTLIWRIIQEDYMWSEDAFYNWCAWTDITWCKFGNPIWNDLTTININDAFYFDSLVWSSHRMEFLNNWLAPTETDYYSKWWNNTVNCEGTFSTCSNKWTYSWYVTYWTAWVNWYQAPNLTVWSGRVWNTWENDEICDYSCANWWNYTYKADEIRIWVK